MAKSKKKKRKLFPGVDKKIYIPLSNVVCALVRLHHLPEPKVYQEVAIISNLPLKSRFAKIAIYPNRTVKYYDRLGTVLLEGSARKIGQIKRDILKWNDKKTFVDDSIVPENFGTHPEPPLPGGFFRSNDASQDDG